MMPLPAIRFALTERCPHNCPYCHREGSHYQPDVSRNLILKVLNSASRLGFSQVRLTGGEPTLRDDLTDVVHDISLFGKFNLKLNTSGYGFAEIAEELNEAGLEKASISLQSLDDNVSRRFNGSFSTIDKAIDAAREVGIEVNINTIIMKGINENEVPTILEYASRKEAEVTFMTLVWTQENASFHERHFISDQRIEEYLQKRANDVSFLEGSAPKLVFTMPDGMKVYLKSRRFSRLFRLSQCQTCAYDERCTEGFYAIRVNGSGSLYPCLLPSLKFKLSKDASEDQVDFLLRNIVNRFSICKVLSENRPREMHELAVAVS